MWFFNELYVKKKYQWYYFLVSDENYNEFDIACLTNLGDLSVYTVNSLRQQLVASALKREDIT